MKGDSGRDCVLMKRDGKVDAEDCPKKMNVICMEGDTLSGVLAHLHIHMV